jgi:hypothetical protein
MNGFLYLLIVDLACIASGTYLVSTEHYGWAWIPFLIAACTSYTEAKSS